MGPPGCAWARASPPLARPIKRPVRVARGTTSCHIPGAELVFYPVIMSPRSGPHTFLVSARAQRLGFARRAELRQAAPSWLQPTAPDRVGPLRLRPRRPDLGFAGIRLNRDSKAREYFPVATALQPIATSSSLALPQIAAISPSRKYSELRRNLGLEAARLQSSPLCSARSLDEQQSVGRVNVSPRQTEEPGDRSQAAGRWAATAATLFAFPCPFWAVCLLDTRGTEIAAHPTPVLVAPRTLLTRDKTFRLCLQLSSTRLGMSSSSSDRPRLTQPTPSRIAGKFLSSWLRKIH